MNAAMVSVWNTSWKPNHDGEGVRLLQAVDQAAERVEPAADDDEHEDRRVAVGDEVVEVEHRRPAERDVDRGVEPPGRALPEQPEQDAGRGAAPGDREQARPGAALQHHQGERRVAAGDEQEDVGVVEPLQGRPGAGAPGAAVVDRGHGEEQSAVSANTTLPTRVAAVGDSTMSTMPAARVSGAVTACSQPRSLGFSSARTVTRCSERCSATSVVVSTGLCLPVMGQRYCRGLNRPPPAWRL